MTQPTPTHPLRVRFRHLDRVHAVRTLPGIVFIPVRKTACAFVVSGTGSQYLPDTTPVTCSACERALAKEADQ